MSQLNGIDIANYQAGLNTGSIPGGFVIVKATESNTYTNPSFSGHAKQTLSAGKKLGIYHFLTTSGDYKAQADHFLSVIKPYIGKALLALDFENTSYSAIQNAAGVAKAKQWLDYVYQQTGVRPVVYMGLACENALDWTSVVKANYGLWVAQYNNYNVVNNYSPRDLYGSIKHWPSAAIFQYTSSGRLYGWGSNLDLDVFYGDNAAWDKYAKASKTPTAPAKPSKPAANAPKWVTNNVTYTLKTAVNLRTGASTGSGLIMTLPAGSVVKTDRAIIQGGYRWVRQPRSGGYGYLVTGPASNTLAYVTTGKKAAPAATIKKGSKVTVTKAVDYSGRSLGVSGTYTVMQINGNRVVIGRGGVVTAAINKANLKLA